MTADLYDVAWASSALRSLDRLPEKIGAACIEFAYGGLAQRRRRIGRPLRVDLARKHSARRGDFRLTYEIDDDRRRVTIIAIDHRSDVYRRR